MSRQISGKDREVKKVYKSLYEVKDKYLPNTDLDFLECNDDEISREAFLKMIEKAVRPNHAQGSKKN